MKKQLGQINTDLKAFLQAQTKAYPALKPLDDPVYLQLAAYFIMAAPLLLLLLPVLLWIITLVAPSSKVRCGWGAAVGSMPLRRLAVGAVYL